MPKRKAPHGRGTRPAVRLVILCYAPTHIRIWRCSHSREHSAPVLMRYMEYISSLICNVGGRDWCLAVWFLYSSLLFAAYFRVGIFGRFPWKADERYSFGIAWEA